MPWAELSAAVYFMLVSETVRKQHFTVGSNSVYLIISGDVHLIMYERFLCIVLSFCAKPMLTLCIFFI